MYTHPAASETTPENSAAYADSPVLCVSCEMAAEGPKKAEMEAAPSAEGPKMAEAEATPAAEGPQKAEAEAEATLAAEGAEAAPAAETAAKGVAEEKAVVVPAPGPMAGDSNSESKALLIADKVANKPCDDVNNPPKNSNDRDIALAKVEIEKRNSLIKAWEENEKSKADNKATKKQSVILSWENTKKAFVEAQLKKNEEELEMKKAEYAEKMKNKKAVIHRQAEEKRAMVMAQRGEKVLKAEEMAAKYRATGVAPKKFLGCFGS